MQGSSYSNSRSSNIRASSSANDGAVGYVPDGAIESTEMDSAAGLAYGAVQNHTYGSYPHTDVRSSDGVIPFPSAPHAGYAASGHQMQGGYINAPGTASGAHRVSSYPDSSQAIQVQSPGQSGYGMRTHHGSSPYSDQHHFSPNTGFPNPTAQQTRQGFISTPAETLQDYGSSATQLNRHNRSSSSSQSNRSSHVPESPSTIYIPEASSSTSEPKRFACPICGNTCGRSHDLQRHMQTHDPGAQAKNKCPRCAKTFSRNDALKRHLDGCLGGGSTA